MTLGLLLPAGLLALAAGLVPLLIHLIRRSEMVISDFAALRWLSAKARPRRRLRFDEYPLLMTRLLLIAAMAMLLAQPALTGWPAARDWLLVVPGVDTAGLPTLDAEGENEAAGEIERRWLAPGLPPLSAPAPAVGATASLLRELDATLSPQSGITVLVPDELTGLDGERLRLSRPVDWRISNVDGAPAEPVAPMVGAEPLPLWLAFAPERAAELRYLRAAAAALAPASGAAEADADNASVGGPSLEIAGEFALPDVLDTFDWPAFGAARLLWLSDQPLPPAVADWVAGGGQVLRVGMADDAVDGDPVTLWHGTGPMIALRAFALGSGRVLTLNARLTPDQVPELLAADFPARLRSWLAAPGPMPSRAPADSQAPEIGLAAYPPPTRGLDDWLALLVAALFLVERWLASAPGRLR